MCVDVSWTLEGETTTEFSGEVLLTFPTPDPEVWELSGGRLFQFGGARWVGTFDPLDIDQATEFESNPEDVDVGFVGVHALLLGANGDLLIRNGNILFANCSIALYGSPPTGDTCADYNIVAQGEYFVVPGDEGAFDGSLTFRHDLTRSLEIVPLSETFNLENAVGLNLTYTRVIPEPGAGLLVMTGLLGLAYRQRRHGRTAGASR
jgi:hypothetical protein